MEIQPRQAGNTRTHGSGHPASAQPAYGRFVGAENVICHAGYQIDVPDDLIGRRTEASQECLIRMLKLKPV